LLRLDFQINFVEPDWRLPNCARSDSSRAGENCRAILSARETSRRGGNHQRKSAVELQIVQKWRQKLGPSPRRSPSGTAFWVNPTGSSALRRACPNLFPILILHAVLILKAPHLAPAYSLSGFHFVDRTRSGFSGLLRPFWAVLGRSRSSGKPL